MALRPFSTLGVKPFLSATEDDLLALQKIFFRLSREHHPDRFVNASPSEQKMAEDRSAQLNGDYQQLKDFRRRLESVVKAAMASGKESAPSRGLPPHLAAEYFEWQESWAEAKDLAAREQLKTELKAFDQKVAAVQNEAVARLEAVAQKFPYLGEGEAPAPWSPTDVETLQTALGDLRYYERLRSQCADPN